MNSRDNSIYIPPANGIGAGMVERWYVNEANEQKHGLYDDIGLESVQKYYENARAWKHVEHKLRTGACHPFFRRHYAETFATALGFIQGAAKQPVVLDLGCGTGNQTLLMALLGWRVVAVDQSVVAIKILKRRVEYYEGLTGRKLHIQIEEKNAFEVDYAHCGPFNAVYSLFAFNMMQPSKKLLDLILPSLSNQGRVVIQDGNSRCLWKLRRSSRGPGRLSPAELVADMRAHGVRLVAQRGCVAVPSLVWSAGPYGLVRALDALLCRCPIFPVSSMLLGCKAGK